MLLALILQLLGLSPPGSPCVTVPGLTYVCTVTVLPPKTVVIGKQNGG